MFIFRHNGMKFDAGEYPSDYLREGNVVLLSKGKQGDHTLYRIKEKTEDCSNIFLDIEPVGKATIVEVR